MLEFIPLYGIRLSKYMLLSIQMGHVDIYPFRQTKGFSFHKKSK